MKDETFHFANEFDQVEDVIGVAQPMRFNSKTPPNYLHQSFTQYSSKMS